MGWKLNPPSQSEISTEISALNSKYLSLHDSSCDFLLFMGNVCGFISPVLFLTHCIQPHAYTIIYIYMKQNNEVGIKRFKVEFMYLKGPLGCNNVHWSDVNGHWPLVLGQNPFFTFVHVHVHVWERLRERERERERSNEGNRKLMFLTTHRGFKIRPNREPQSL